MPATQRRFSIELQQQALVRVTQRGFLG